jgi:hypothetical protein
MDPSIELVPVSENDMVAFKQRLQASFTAAAYEAFPDFGEVIPPERDIEESLAAVGAEPLQVVRGGVNVGGAIVTGDGRSMFLDFLFIDPEFQNLHVGYGAMQALEGRYPQARSWELVTPYHEKRNIHFYVNRCGFSIVEYYNDHHPDPHYPQEEAGSYPGEDSGMFRFRKVLP